MPHKIFRIIMAMLIACAALSLNVGTAHANISIICKDGKITVSLVDFPQNQHFHVIVNGQNVGAKIIYTYDKAGNLISQEVKK